MLIAVLAQRCWELLVLVGSCCLVCANEPINCRHCWRSFKEAMLSGTVSLARRVANIIAIPYKWAQCCCIKGLTGFKILYMQQVRLMGSHGLSVHAASPPDLNAVQKFLIRCYKRNYLSHPVNDSELVEKSDLAIANRTCEQPSYPLLNLFPRFKESSL